MQVRCNIRCIVLFGPAWKGDPAKKDNPSIKGRRNLGFLYVLQPLVILAKKLQVSSVYKEKQFL